MRRMKQQISQSVYIMKPINDCSTYAVTFDPFYRQSSDPYSLTLFSGGCSAFGHSCFGGHGKRSDPSDRFENTIQEDLSQSQDNNQDFDTPRWRTRGGGEILIADGGQIYQNRPMPRDEPPQHSGYNLSPFIRQLVYNSQ